MTGKMFVRVLIVVAVSVSIPAAAANAQTAFAATFQTGVMKTDVGPVEGVQTFPLLDYGVAYTYAGAQGETLGFGIGAGGSMRMFRVELVDGREVGFGAADAPFSVNLFGNVTLRVKNVSGGFVFETRRLSVGAIDHENGFFTDFGDYRNVFGYGFTLRGDIHRSALQVEYMKHSGGQMETAHTRENGEYVEGGRTIRLTFAQFFSTTFGVKVEWSDSRIGAERTGPNLFGDFDHRSRSIVAGIILAIVG